MNNKVSLAFTGDIGFDKYMDGQWRDPALIAPSVLDFLHSADHVIANVEGPLIRKDALQTAVSPQEGTAGAATGSQQKQAGTAGVATGSQQKQAGTAQLLHSMDPAAAEVLDRMHADIWNLCNNHIMDAGETGIAATLAQAEAHHARTIGAGMNIEEAARPVILPDAGGIGMFSCGYRRGCKPAAEDHAGCLLWNDLDRIQTVIDHIHETCRWCVMVVHGGEEFTSLPSPYTRDRYLKFLEMGADVIVAHHPHVPMNYEILRKPERAGSGDSGAGEAVSSTAAGTTGSTAQDIHSGEQCAENRIFRKGDKVIFYSLGNFIFDTDYQRAQFNTEKGLLVKLNFTEDDYSFKAMGLEIERGAEHVKEAELPAIFTNVGEKDYGLLEPLAAKMFVAATKRQQIYLNPKEFRDADETKWKEHFANPKRSGRVPGEGLDFFIICPLAAQEKEKAWQKSSLEGVKRYILEQM